MFKKKSRNRAGTPLSTRGEGLGVGFFFFLFLFPFSLFAQRQMEYLDRGLYVTADGKGNALVSWRLLATDNDAVAFDVYKTVGNQKALKLNTKPITTATDFLDEKIDSTKTNSYLVKVLENAKEISASKPFTIPVNAKPYMSIPLKQIPGYTPNDASVADLDGDGEYEIILHQTGRGRDNSQGGVTDPPIFQAYKMDGTLLWQINLGKNIREGAHYTQFMVYDLDGDGFAEIAMKTADGTIDGQGKVIGDSTKDYRMTGSRQMEGRILSGPEYFTIFDGRTGKELATTNYIPARGNIGAWGGVGGNGGNDNYGNRVDRFLACVAYLDGVHPSVIMCRGYYGRTVLAAWDWRGGKLSSRWVFDSKDASNPYSGMGYHNLTVADVDGDGKDEIVYGSMCVDDNGKGLYTTGLRHGDALHVSDLDPSRPGMEVYGVHEIEEGTKGPGTAMYDAKTGAIIFTGDLDSDVGRGVAVDIDPRYPGAECWGGKDGLKTCKGEIIGKAPRSQNFIVQWDDDPLYELLDGTSIFKWDYKNAQMEKIFDARMYDCASDNGSKANPALSGDIFGDWREEVMYRTVDGKELRIFSTPIPSTKRMVTLLQDPQYRLSLVWQNVGYNQPPHTSYFFGNDMKTPPKPNIVIVKKQ